MYNSDPDVAVRRLRFDSKTGALAEAPRKEPFLRGPIPLNWLSVAAQLPGKTLNVAIALWWLQGMAQGKPVKLTQSALKAMNLERDAARAGLARLEKGGLIMVERKPGQRPTVVILGSRGK